MSKSFWIIIQCEMKDGERQHHHVIFQKEAINMEGQFKIIWKHLIIRHKTRQLLNAYPDETRLGEVANELELQKMINIIIGDIRKNAIKEPIITFSDKPTRIKKTTIPKEEGQAFYKFSVEMAELITYFIENDTLKGVIKVVKDVVTKNKWNCFCK